MRVLSALILTAALCASAAMAQSPLATGTTCDGIVATVRHSTIRPEAGIDKFMAAVDAQKAWYVSHGLKDDIIFATKLLIRDPTTKTLGYTTAEALSIHYYPATPGPEIKHDAAWDAFVKLFSESSIVKDTYSICVPVAMVPANK